MAKKFMREKYFAFNMEALTNTTSANLQIYSRVSLLVATLVDALVSFAALRYLIKIDEKMLHRTDVVG